jgi:hypothetical protein
MRVSNKEGYSKHALDNMENVASRHFRHSFFKNLANAGTSIQLLDDLSVMKVFKQSLFMLILHRKCK